METSASFEARYAPLSYPTEGGARRAAMVDLNGHAAGNGGHSQGTPTAHRALLYSDIDGNAVNQALLSLLVFALPLIKLERHIHLHLASTGSPLTVAGSSRIFERGLGVGGLGVGLGVGRRDLHLGAMFATRSKPLPKRWGDVRLIPDGETVLVNKNISRGESDGWKPPSRI